MAKQETIKSDSGKSYDIKDGKLEPSSGPSLIESVMTYIPRTVGNFASK